MLSEPFRVPSTAIFLSVIFLLETGVEKSQVVRIGSVLVSQGTLDVHGVQQNEHVGLQELNQELQEGDQDEEQPGHHSDDRVGTGHLDDKVLATEGEEDEQHVAGAHVREQTQGQRDRANKDFRHALERNQQRSDEHTYELQSQMPILYTDF